MRLKECELQMVYSAADVRVDITGQHAAITAVTISTAHIQHVVVDRS